MRLLQFRKSSWRALSPHGGGGKQPTDATFPTPDMSSLRCRTPLPNPSVEVSLAARPLVLVTGILGAGKTTLLRMLLPVLQRLDVPARVVINDYHNAAVDAATLAHVSEEVTAVSGSCVCCESRDELFDVLALPPRRPDEVLLVETNGTTDTLELLEALATDSRTCSFRPLQVGLVDCQRWQLDHWQQELELRQVQTASHVVFTRGAQVSKLRQAAVKASVSAVNRQAVTTTPERLAQLLMKLASQRRWFVPGSVRERRLALTPSRVGSREEHPHHHHEALAHGFTSVELTLPAGFDEKLLRSWLAALPEFVLRVKGITRLRDEPDALCSFQRVGRDVELARYPVAGRRRFGSRAILIGPHLDGAALCRQAARALQEESPAKPRRARRVLQP